jgi:hypothetical protein
MKKTNKKTIKKPEYFILKFPNMSEALIKVNGWYGCTAYTEFIKEEYYDQTVAVSISRREAFKFFLKGRLFDVNK